MCYICAPNQFRFYGQERLTVCVEYCDRMYDACAEAILKGSRINQIYSNGEEFCKSRRYNIDKSNKRNSCFFYDIQDTNLNFSSSVLVNKWLLFIGFLTFTLVEKFLVPCWVRSGLYINDNDIKTVQGLLRRFQCVFLCS